MSFPAAFWLEPHWRNTKVFTIDWLFSHAKALDIVLLIHPENVLESPELTEQLGSVTSHLESRILS